MDVVQGVDSWIDAAIHWLVALVDQLGIGGVFIMTFLESTFAPIPSEATMIPAGYLVHEGKMSLAAVLIASISGTVSGAYFNYWIARHFGRGLLLRYGKYFFIPPEKLEKIELFFASHGPISIFTGRLILGVRHFISFPAGLAKMDLKKFFLYTALGGSLWMSILIALGYSIGKNQELVTRYVPMIKLGICAVVAVLITGYILRHSKRKKRGI